jgi:hypothetical protein
MAGANNAQRKTGGPAARNVEKMRQPPPGWSAAARGEGGEQRQAVRAARERHVRGEALDAYRQRAASASQAGDEGHRALRQSIRDQIKRVGEAEHTASRGEDPQDYTRAKNEMAKLQSLLRSRDSVARGRKQERTPGQGDLFGMAPAARGPSPFDRRVTERRAMLAAAGERARGRLTGLQATTRHMLATRRNEDRAAIVASRLQSRATAAMGSTRGDIAMGRLQQLVKRYPNAGRLGAQIRAEQGLASRQAVKRIMRTSMGGSTDRQSAGLPAQRSPRMEGLLRRADATQAAREAGRKRVKDTLAGKVSAQQSRLDRNRAQHDARRRAADKKDRDRELRAEAASRFAAAEKAARKKAG